MQFIRLCLVLLLAVCAFVPHALAQSPGDDTLALIKAIQQGGYVIYMRHADTTGEPRDRTLDLTNRALQRNLSVQGRLQSVEIGRAIERFGLPVGRVASSPVFRAADTAQLAFGADRVEIDPELTADDYVSTSYQPYVRALRRQLAESPANGNTWLVGHVIPLSMAAGAGISRSSFGEGAAAVFRTNDNNEGFELVGILNTGWERLSETTD